MKNNKPLVSILCPTYNHRSYIRRCIDGFLAQKADFSFEILVNDDASIDGTTDILKEYKKKCPDIIELVLHEENQYQKGVRGMTFKFLLPKARGNYLAICEGDDYWTDPAKLQKQVDFMEKCSECGLLYTDLDFLYDDAEQIEKAIYKNNIMPRSKNFAEHLLAGGYIAPCTWLLRKNDMSLIDATRNPSDFTFEVALEMLANDKVRFMSQVTATYRRHGGSVTNTKDKKEMEAREKGLARTRQYYIKKYPSEFMEGLNKLIAEKDKLIAEKDKLIAEKDKLIAGLDQELGAIIGSKSYRIGRAITAPRRVLKRTKNDSSS